MCLMDVFNGCEFLLTLDIVGVVSKSSTCWLKGRAAISAFTLLDNSKYRNSAGLTSRHVLTRQECRNGQSLMKNSL